MFSPDPRAYLPHRPPFLFLDRVVALETGVSASAELTLGPQRQLSPLLLVEAMAQLGGIAAGQREGEGGVLAALAGVKLPPAVPAQGTLVLVSRVLKRFGRMIRVEAEARERDQVIASALITLAMEGAALRGVFVNESMGKQC